MKKGLVILVVIAIIVVGIIMWGIGLYNNFVAGDENVKNKWSQVESDYQRRFDLIPNLIATVQGSAEFQKSTFAEVTEARSAWARAKERGDIAEGIAAANSFESALGRLLVTVEAYPDLDSTAFNDMMTSLEGTENRINVSRKDYNDAVKLFNVSVRRFPAMIIARLFGFDIKTPFEAVEGADVAPEVDFDFSNEE